MFQRRSPGVDSTAVDGQTDGVMMMMKALRQTTNRPESYRYDVIALSMGS